MTRRIILTVFVVLILRNSPAMATEHRHSTHHHSHRHARRHYGL